MKDESNPLRLVMASGTFVFADDRTEPEALFVSGDVFASVTRVEDIFSTHIFFQSIEFPEATINTATTRQTLRALGHHITLSDGNGQIAIVDTHRSGSVRTLRISA
jgi:hypothetical protein